MQFRQVQCVPLPRASRAPVQCCRGWGQLWSNGLAQQMSEARETGEKGKLLPCKDGGALADRDGVIYLHGESL